MEGHRRQVAAVDTAVDSGRCRRQRRAAAASTRPAGAIKGGASVRRVSRSGGLHRDRPIRRGPPEASGPPPLVRLLQEFSLEANRYVDSAGGRNDMHRTDLNALAVIMRHTARDQIVTPGVLRKELHLSSPATTALIDRLHRSGHVVRERQGTDRRQVQLRMTPKAYRDGGAMFLSAGPPHGRGDGRIHPGGTGDCHPVHDVDDRGDGQGRAGGGAADGTASS